MPLIPVYAARRRYVRLHAGGDHALLEDTTFSFRRIPPARFVPESDRSIEVRVEGADVPAFEIAAPPGSGVRFAPGPGSDDVLIVPEAAGAASVELPPRDAHWSALRGELGLCLILACEPVAGGEAE